MSEKTGISWTDATFNPWWGCMKVSPACDHCYAERDANRFAPGKVLWGVGSERRIFDVATEAGRKHWGAPLGWAKRAFVQCAACGWRGMHTKLRHIGGEHECPACSSKDWHAARVRVFCASMGDWLDLDAPISEFVRLLETIRLTPELDWLLLSKRIGNWRKRLHEALDWMAPMSSGYSSTIDWVQDWLDGYAPPNVVLMATVVNQPESDRDVVKLLAIPARRRGLSIEPMLGPINLKPFVGGTEDEHDGEGGPHCVRCGCFYDSDHECPAGFGPRLDWVIAGGESGPHARPMHPDWVRSLRDQCAAAGVPFHFKQWGEWTPGENVERQRGVVNTAFAHDGEWHVYPLNLATDHGHVDDQPDLYRVGKKAAGRLLDGVEHNGFPS